MTNRGIDVAVIRSEKTIPVITLGYDGCFL
jgi:hypothetical protein